MDSPTENQESRREMCPHCGKRLSIAETFARRALPAPRPCPPAITSVARTRECAPIEELRTHGLV